ncbi:MAG: hypothetical protein AB4057_02130 [Crocosphaera sp.]
MVHKIDSYLWDKKTLLLWIGVILTIKVVLVSCAVNESNAVKTFTQTTSNMKETNINQLISLEEIWALDMPGTRPMNRTMRGEPLIYESPEGQLVDEIRKALGYDLEKKADQCFAVSGEGMKALQEAHKVIVQGKEKKTKFSQDESISIVFFSSFFASYVHLVKVEKKGKVIQIIYRFVPHQTKEVTAHIALIPISHLETGQIQVEIKPETETQISNFDAEQWGQKIVCRPFVFQVS